MRVIIAGGGTGGHLFPGIAIAEAFQKRDPTSEVLFVGTDRGIEKRVVPENGYALRTIDIEGLKGRGIRSLLALLKIPWSLVQAVRIIRDFAPDLAIGVGGYASGPVVAAARLLGIQTAVAEQNAIPGLTNRILGHLVHRVFLTFPDEGRYFAPTKVTLSGNPIRSSFVAHPDRPRDGSFTVLVFGGSQGARRINQTMIEAFPFLKGLGGLRIVHQTGAADCERITEAYRTANADGNVDITVRPFIAEMADAFAEADLLICRAGATSIAEIAASGKAAVLIPFPYAAHDHQTQNARVMTEAGAAIMVPEKTLNGKVLGQIIESLHSDPDRLRAMSERAAQMGKPDAADTIVNACLALLKNSK